MWKFLAGFLDGTFVKRSATQYLICLSEMSCLFADLVHQIIVSGTPELRQSKTGGSYVERTGFHKGLARLEQVCRAGDVFLCGYGRD